MSENEIHARAKVTKETHAYTPGLKVQSYTTIEKNKKLPITGDVLVTKGDKVSFDTIIARTQIIGMPFFVNVAKALNIEPLEIPNFMIKKNGEEVKKGETIAILKLLFGLITNKAVSPVDGYIDTISPETGRVTIREPRIPVEVKSNLRGTIIEVIPQEGAIIRTKASYIQGIFGFGGETNGQLTLLVQSTNEIISADKILPIHKGKILVTGAMVTQEILKAAVKCGVVGLISGGMDFTDLLEFIGKELGVAITGEKEALTLVITEGFGRMNISKRAFGILQDMNNKMVAINGTTQIRAGVIRPEIICCRQQSDQEVLTNVPETGMKPGTLVRIIQRPFFGELGRVISLPSKLEKIETESLVRIVEVKLESGKTVIVPRANVEIIEE